jgi:hypothetical protein
MTVVIVSLGCGFVVSEFAFEGFFGIRRVSVGRCVPVPRGMLARPKVDDGGGAIRVPALQAKRTRRGGVRTKGNHLSVAIDGRLRSASQGALLKRQGPVRRGAAQPPFVRSGTRRTEINLFYREHRKALHCFQPCFMG